MSDPPPLRPELERYARQIRYAPIGREGQEQLLRSRVLICGCGALGSVLANTLARAGVGQLRIVDRDFLELNNLQRQVLYDEEDVAAGIPKAIAAQRRLQRINSAIDVEAIVADVDHTNIGQLVCDTDVIIDGTDNFEIRYLLNDAAAKYQIPWIYGGCIGAVGQTMSILPGTTPCFRCLHPDPPPPGTTETCDSAGILGPVINVIASIQACEAIKILTNHRDQVSRELLVVELWEKPHTTYQTGRATTNRKLSRLRSPAIPVVNWPTGQPFRCAVGHAVQLSSPDRTRISLMTLEEKLQGIGTVVRNEFLLRLNVDGYTITVFPDGRAIINGTEDVAEAKTLYARYIGA